MWEDSERRRQRVRVSIFVLALATLLVAWLRLDSDSRSAPAIISAIDAWFTGTPQPVSRPAPSAAAAAPGTSTAGTAPGSSTSVGTTGGSGGTGPRDYRVNPSPDRNAVTPRTTAQPRLVLPREAAPVDETGPPSRPDPCDPRPASGQDAGDRVAASRPGDPPCEVDRQPSSSSPRNAN